MANKEFTTKNTYKTLEFDEIFEFLDKNGTDEEKKEFAENCYTKYDRDAKKNIKYNADGTPKTKATDKLNFIYAKQQFCSKFAPDLLPVKKEKEEKEKKTDKLKCWL